MDDDVQKEKEKINKMELSDLKGKNLVLKDMTKYYGSFLAVNQISLTVDQ
jgi:ATP-binding cassette, subfamily A (ABC1), member 3